METHRLPRLNREEIELLNRPIPNNKIEATIKKTSQQKKSRPDGFITEFYEIYKEKGKRAKVNTAVFPAVSC